eukprot:gene2980-12990_t
MPSRGLVLSLVLLATICRTITPQALHSDIPHVSKCNLCEICEMKPGQAHRRLRKMLSFYGNGHQERPADPADRLEQLTDERLDKMFSEMKARGDRDALELDLHEFEWDSVAAGIQTASVGPHRDLLEYDEDVEQRKKDIERSRIYREEAEGDREDRDHAMKYGGAPLEAIHKSIVPTKADLAAKKLLPNCTRCYGCKTTINTLKSGSRQARGASNGNVMIKVWCMPIDKVHKTMNWACKSDRIAMRANQFLLAQQSVVWIDPVGAIVPEYGVHIWWNGLWMEKADGISMSQLSRTRVVEVALMDLLTTQCDRHSQNVFINEHGNIKVIDNPQIFFSPSFMCDIRLDDPTEIIIIVSTLWATSVKWWNWGNL